MNGWRRWFPHPTLSAALLILWLWLNNTLAAGQIVFGALVGIAVPLFTHRFWPEHVTIKRPFRLTGFLAMVLWDIITANIMVAGLILGPRRRLKPSFVVVPLDLTNDFATTVLTSVVSLTPGTVSADLSADRRSLLLHSLSSKDDEALARSVKERYEKPISEIFGC